MKGKALLSSILTIALCLSLIAGSTFALFTSENSTNIAVTSGKVDVQATIEGVMLYSPTSISASGNVIDATDASTATAFKNGGTALFTDDNTLTLDRVTPGDKVTATIKLTNNSNVAIQYRTIIKGGDGDNALLAGLRVTFGEGDDAQSFTGSTIKSAWTAFDGTAQTIQVTIELPTTAGNEYQDLSCGLIFTVEAVQGNAEMPNEWDGTSADDVPEADEKGTITITSAAQLVGMMNATQNVNSAYLGKTIRLACDIDFGGATIQGLGSDQCNFAGDFDGQGHTISNFVINNSRERYTGLFNQLGPNGSVKNLTVENATVIGNKMVGIISSNVEGDAVVDNCHVKNCTIVANVKKAGAITGYTSNGTVTNCSATDCTVVCKNADEAESNQIVGYVNTGSTVKDNTATNVTVKRGVGYVLTNATEFQAYITELNNDPAHGAHRYDCANVVLTSDIDLGGAVITVSGEGYQFSGSFDGLGHTVSNYTIQRTDSKYFTGLFSVYMSDGGEIKNLTVKNGTVISNGSQVGAVVASVNDGATVENCKAFNCIVSGKDQVGSVVGYVCDGIVKDCYAEDCTVLYSEGKHQTNQEYPNGNGNGKNNGEVVGFINTINLKVDNTTNNTFYNVTVGQGTCLANGVTQNAAGEYLISSAQGLVWCATSFNTGDNTRNKVFKLTADIDMTGITWTPWCNEGQYFNGLFDGQNHTISNLTITDNDTAETGHAVGFIGRLGSNGLGTNTIQNVKFENANVSGHHWVGVAVGYNEFGKVDNVHVANSKVTATCATTDPDASPCGDKAGALIGICGPNTSCITVSNCSATNCEVKAARDAAQLIGYGYTGSSYTNLSATNVIVKAVAGDCAHTRAGLVSANALIGNGTAAGLTLN